MYIESVEETVKVKKQPVAVCEICGHKWRVRAGGRKPIRCANRACHREDWNEKGDAHVG